MSAPRQELGPKCCPDCLPAEPPAAWIEAVASAMMRLQGSAWEYADEQYRELLRRQARVAYAVLLKEIGGESHGGN